VKPAARELLEKVRVAHLERENPRNLSGGEARRVAVARSLIVTHEREPPACANRRFVMDAGRLTEQ
jgi:ABC-type lipoprotein export system ATPase subunit